MTATRSTSTICADLVIKGRINRCRSLDVHGYIEGGIDAEELRIHPGGRVFGSVRADRIEVYGHLQGDVRVKTLISIGSTGTVNGNIRYGQLALAPGGELSADVRNVPPEVHGDLQMAVRRGRSVPITLADLNAVDPDSAETDIQFAVSNTAAGHVADVDAPNTAIDAFSQADLSAGRVIFVNDNGALGQGGFDVVVTDNAGGTAPAQRVTVTIV
ncbi:MAG: polymer-forming cytoskeletal protein [Hyphomicrobiaceae bacterium]